MAGVDAMFDIPDLGRRQSVSVGGRPVHQRFQDVYRIEGRLGRGGFGAVMSCSHLESGLECAVKVVDKSGATKQRHEAQRSEVQILQLLRSTHPNFVQLIETFESRNHLYIVMEMVKGGMLLRQIERSKNFSESTARRMVTQLLIALEFMHGKGIVHRDLKPANLLLTEPNIDATIKICDFGFAKLIGDDPAITGCTGTLMYMAPEVLVPGMVYGKPVDIWSLGVIVYIMVCGLPPFGRHRDRVQAQRRGSRVPVFASHLAKLRHCTQPEESVSAASGRRPSAADRDPERQALIGQITRAQYSFPAGTLWDSVSAECTDFITKLLTLDTTARHTAGDALHHPWIRSEISGPTRDLKEERAQFRDYPTFRAAVTAVVAAFRLCHTLRTRGIPGDAPVVRSVALSLGSVVKCRPFVDSEKTESQIGWLKEFLSCHPTGLRAKVLRASSCCVTNEVLGGIVDAVAGHPSIEAIHLSDNPFDRESERALIKLVSAQSALRSLALSSTGLPDEVVQRIHSSIGTGGSGQAKREVPAALPTTSPGYSTQRPTSTAAVRKTQRTGGGGGGGGGAVSGRKPAPGPSRSGRESPDHRTPPALMNQLQRAGTTASRRAPRTQQSTPLPPQTRKPAPKRPQDRVSSAPDAPQRAGTVTLPAQRTRPGSLPAHLPTTVR